MTEVKSKLQALANQNNFVAQELLDKFLKRFETTADLTLAHLAFIFTAEGLEAFRISPNDQEKRKTRASLKEKFLEITRILGQKFSADTHFLPAFRSKIHFCSTFTLTMLFSTRVEIH